VIPHQWVARLLPGRATALVVNLIEVRRFLDRHVPSRRMKDVVATETDLKDARMYPASCLTAAGAVFPAYRATATGPGDGSGAGRWLRPSPPAAAAVDDAVAEEMMTGGSPTFPRQLAEVPVVLEVRAGDPVHVRVRADIDLGFGRTSVSFSLPAEFWQTGEGPPNAKEVG